MWNLIEEHTRLEKIKQRQLSIYIAMTIMGQDPLEEEIKESKGVAGRDYPCDPSLLRGL